jgi:hypothetical protein
VNVFEFKILEEEKDKEENFSAMHCIPFIYYVPKPQTEERYI